MYSNYQQPSSDPYQSNQRQPVLEVFNELENYQQMQVKKLLPIEEQIYFSGVVEKVNKNLVAQRRILVITNKSLYNIQPDDDGLIPSLIISISPKSALKRKIDIKKIYGITISVDPRSDKGQFIIHVTDEYDYRYNAAQKLEKIVKTIMNIYWCNFGTPFVIYMKEEGDLAKYHTTEEDHKVRIDKRPKDGQMLVTKEMMNNGLNWLISNRGQFIKVAQPKPQPQFIQQQPIPKPIYTNQPLTMKVVNQPTFRVQPVQVIPTTKVITINTAPITNIANRVVIATTTQPQYVMTNQRVNYTMAPQIPVTQIIQPQNNMMNVPQPQTYAPQNFAPQSFVPQPVQEKPQQVPTDYQPGLVSNDLINSSYQNVQVTTNFEATLAGKK